MELCLHACLQVPANMAECVSPHFDLWVKVWLTLPEITPAALWECHDKLWDVLLTTNWDLPICVSVYVASHNYCQWEPLWTSPVCLLISFDWADWWLLTWLIYWDEVSLTLQHMVNNLIAAAEALQLFDKSPGNQVWLHHGGLLWK